MQSPVLKRELWIPTAQLVDIARLLKPKEAAPICPRTEWPFSHYGSYLSQTAPHDRIHGQAL